MTDPQADARAALIELLYDPNTMTADMCDILVDHVLRKHGDTAVDAVRATYAEYQRKCAERTLTEPPNLDVDTDGAVVTTIALADLRDLVAAYNALDKIRAAYIKCHEAPAHTAEDDAEAQLQLRLTVGHVLYPSTRTPAVGDPVYCVKDGPDYNKFGIVDSVSPAGDTIVILRPSGSRVVSTDDWKPLPGVPPQ